jgi:chromosome condensin MukBEF ATPase and DNA-binding subunit MukB
MFREVLQAKQHVLGAEDEETLSLTRDLAHCLRKQGKHLEAEAYNRPVSVRAQASQFTDSSESIAIA